MALTNVLRIEKKGNCEIKKSEKSVCYAPTNLQRTQKSDWKPLDEWVCSITRREEKNENERKKYAKLTKWIWVLAKYHYRL